MSTNVRSSGLLLAAIAATSVRSNSLLPAPVVPAIRAWGPSRDEIDLDDSVSRHAEDGARMTEVARVAIAAASGPPGGGDGN